MYLLVIIFGVMACGNGIFCLRVLRERNEALRLLKDKEADVCELGRVLYEVYSTSPKLPVFRATVPVATDSKDSVRFAVAHWLKPAQLIEFMVDGPWIKVYSWRDALREVRK